MKILMKLLPGAMSLCISLSSCAETTELYAVRHVVLPNGTASARYDGARDDRPRVMPIASAATVKGSFAAVVADQCGSVTKEPSADAKPWPEEKDWANRMATASQCSLQVAAYAVDQCEWMAVSQNEVSITAKSMTGAALTAASVATDGVLLAHPRGDHTTGLAVVATNITTNGGGISDFIPPTVTVAPGDMIDVAPKYAYAVGLTDDDVVAAVMPKEFRTPASTVGLLKLARVHDAVLSMCMANAIGTRKPQHRP